MNSIENYSPDNGFDAHIYMSEVNLKIKNKVILNFKILN